MFFFTFAQEPVFLFGACFVFVVWSWIVCIPDCV